MNKGLFVMPETWISFYNIHIFKVNSDTINQFPVAV
jgi:hypothetical protein